MFAVFSSRDNEIGKRKKNDRREQKSRDTEAGQLFLAKEIGQTVVGKIVVRVCTEAACVVVLLPGLRNDI